MAFQTNRSTQSSNSFQSSKGSAAATSKASVSDSKTKNIVISGMYDGKPGSKLIVKGGKLKEAVTIPAGYTVKLFQKGGVSKNGKELPTYELVAQPPRDAE